MSSSRADGCMTGGCGPGPGNQPPCDGSYASSIGVTLQGVVDGARKMVHEMGLRRDRVFLVWQRQNEITRRWEEFRRVELMPVKVTGVDDVAVYIAEGGLANDGEITVSEVSPAQVSMRMLAGEIDGGDWPDDSEREFFFEIQRYARCAGDDPEHRLRFTRASQIDASKPFGLTFKLMAQHARRRPDGRDGGVKKVRRRADVKLTT